MLSVGLGRYEDLLVCDLAQYYGIHDYRSYEVKHIATLTSGLPDESRVMKQLTGNQYGIDTRLTALLVDLLQNYTWVRFGKKGSPPTSLYKIMSNTWKEEAGFETVEAFETAKQAILDRVKDE